MRRSDPRITHRRPELSQHFLRDAAVARALVRRLGFSRGDLVVEAGAGDGLLTQALEEAGLRVIAVEKDERLYARLRQRFARQPNIECRFGDFLAFPLPSTPYDVVSNVPYGITAAVVRKLLHAARPPDEAVLIVQREAAEKFAGAPRETQFSLLHKPWFEIGIVGTVPRRDFTPEPRVQSALLRLQPRTPCLIDEGSAPTYRSFIQECFGRGAPEVSHGLRRYLTARQIKRLARDHGFVADARPSQLNFDQWLAIFRFVEHECLGHDPTLRRKAAAQAAAAGEEPQIAQISQRGSGRSIMAA
jgi:23S rRNA (adenine-N6)-dimethyltransferase